MNDADPTLTVRIVRLHHQGVTGSVIPGAGTGDDSLRLERLLGAGPVLILHTASTREGNPVESPASVKTAELVAKQLRARGVYPVIDTLGQADAYDAAGFPGLILVLPDASEMSDRLFRAAAQTLKDYRRRKPRGLAWLLAENDRAFHQAGVTQVIGHQAVLDDHRLAKSLAKVCARHLVDVHEPPFDVIAPYLGRPLVVVAPSTVPEDMEADAMATVVEYLRSWEITDITHVPRLRECIEEWRRRLENRNRYPGLARPVDDRPMNRLDFILDEPDYKRPYSETGWQDDGARVTRMVHSGPRPPVGQPIADAPYLKKITPGLARPSGRGNTKDAQRDLHRLYHALCALHDFMDATEPDDWPSLS